MLKIILIIAGALLALLMFLAMLHSLGSVTQAATQQGNAAVAQIQQMQSMGR